MKIGNLIDTTALAGNSATSSRPGVGEAAGQPASAATAATGGNAPTESATVKLSSTAASLMAATPEFNASKVAAIRQSITEGTFRPQPEVIADKLIANAQELLSPPSSH